MNELTFEIRPAAPYRLDLTAMVIKRRAENLLDFWDGTAYRRVLTIAAPPPSPSLKGRESQTVRMAVVSVNQTGPVDDPVLRVDAEMEAAQADGDVVIIRAALERLLGVNVDLTGFHAMAANDSHLGPLAARFRGFRPPRMPSLFEAMVNAVACQQLTLTFGMTLMSRLCAKYGPGDESLPAFPSPHTLAGLAAEDLKALAYSTAKAKTIVQMAGAFADGQFRDEEFDALDNASAIAKLRTLWGIGRWTAEYALLRGLGRLDSFPADDAGGRNNIRRWLGIEEPLTYDTINAILVKWAPYQGLLFFLLMLDKIGAGE